jgi:hypothetical protein
LDGPLAPVASSVAGQGLQPAQWSAEPLLSQPPHQQGQQLPHPAQQHQRQQSMSEVLSLRLDSQAGGDAAGTHRQGKETDSCPHQLSTPAA